LLVNRKPSQLKRNNGVAFCSRKCYAIAKKKFMMGEKNHQHGQHWMGGQNNPNYKGGTSIYKLDTYRRNAKKREIKFELTIEDMKEYWQKPCYYCGDKILTIGLDRVNSKIGYIKDNIVSCCPLCNWMKRELPYCEFINHIRKVYSKHASGEKTEGGGVG
jgi:hypothetical protein